MTVYITTRIEYPEQNEYIVRVNATQDAALTEAVKQAHSIAKPNEIVTTVRN